MQKQEFIDIGHFDREYGLRDLLPEDLAREVLGEVSRHLPMAIILPDGRIHCDLSHEEFQPSVPKGRAPFTHEEGQVSLDPAEDRIRYFPLRHELENIGYLTIFYKQEATGSGLVSLGEFIAKVVNQILHLEYKNRMTAGLHVQVVEESYRQLKEKAAKLQHSEEKYRKLSQNLEIEVLRKTEKIKAAQLMMLQQEKLASIGQLAAGMAHEINNPIGFIISNLNTLGANVRDTVHILRQYQQLNSLWAGGDGPDPATASAIGREMTELDRLCQKLDIDFIVTDMHTLIAECLDGAGRISTIVENLRDFAHPSIESLETADINQCLDTTLSIISGQIPAGVTIRKHYLEIPKIRCYLRELNQVFFHILRNAVQAAGDKGEISISTQLTEDEIIHVAITDSGPGIPKAHLPHLFEPFFTTRPVGTGTGLGLHLAHNIIKKHGGSIEAESLQTAGSRFTVRIPVNEPQDLLRSSGDRI